MGHKGKVFPKSWDVQHSAGTVGQQRAATTRKQAGTAWHREGKGARRLAGKAIDEARKNPSPFFLQALGQQVLLAWLGYRKGREYSFTVSQRPAAVWSPLGVLRQRQAPPRVLESSSRSRVRPQDKVCPFS